MFGGYIKVKNFVPRLPHSNIGELTVDLNIPLQLIVKISIHLK